MARRRRNTRWIYAKAALEEILGRYAPTDGLVRVGRVSRLGGGCSREAWGAHVELSPDPARVSGPWVALLPASSSREDYPTLVHREAELLQALGERELPFRIPRVAGITGTTRPILVLSWVEGLPLDFRAERAYDGAPPWALVARLAAQVHRIDPDSLEVSLPGTLTRQEQVLDELKIFEGLDEDPFPDALDWAREQLPDPEQPNTLLHGDLLGQNILCPLLHRQPLPGLVDWAFVQRGDPALDLAIVTRGRRTPFAAGGTPRRLLEAYLEAGGPPVTLDQIHFYELVMIAAWYKEALEDEDDGPPPAHYRQQVEGLLRRVSRS
ncbi:MAG: phosphotransferase [Alphaproteobacteria bacterium]|nr:phosphotransferase [Alphaproteobacteria bacterium]